MAALRAVGFDLDGTLFDHRTSARAGFDRFYQELGIAVSDSARSAWFAEEEKQFERWRSGEISFQEQRRERLRTVLPPLGIEPPSDDRGLDSLFDLYLREYRIAWQLFPDSIELLEVVRRLGYRIGLLTNGSEQQQLDKLRQTDLIGEFDVVCTSERLGVQKPDPRAFRALAAELGVAPSECLFIGDNPSQDAQGARSAGMPSLLVDRYQPDSDRIVETVIAELAKLTREAP